MFLKDISKLSLIGFMVLSLTACQTLKGSKTTPAISTGTISDTSDSANASGANDSPRFTDDENGNSSLRVGEQTYYFDFDRSDIHDNDRSSIEVQGRYLAEHTNATILLEGHTDPRGSAEYNVALGQRRADSVANALKTLGAKPSQIRTVSFGAQKALAGNTEQDYQLDRRVHLGYEDKG